MPNDTAYANTITLAAAGAPLKDARGAVVMLHGRGSSAEDILALASEFRQTDLAYYLAPRRAVRSATAASPASVQG